MKTDDLRLFIQAALMSDEKYPEAYTKKIPPGAGIVVVRQFDQGWRVLGLILDDLIDIPKGVIEPDEKPLQTAIRETLEEAGLSQINFEWGTEPLVVDQLTCYVASTQQDPIIIQNPKTGIYEHQGFAWLTWEEMLGDCYPYLQPAVGWARDVVEGLQSFPS